MSSNDNTPDNPAEPLLQHMAQQMAIVQMAQQITRETFVALAADEGYTTQANALASQALAIIAPDGGMRMVTMCATAAVVASVVMGIIQTDLEEDGKALPSDAQVMALCMMANHLIQSHRRGNVEALNAAVEADPTRAN